MLVDEPMFQCTSGMRREYDIRQGRQGQFVKNGPEDDKVGIRAPEKRRVEEEDMGILATNGRHNKKPVIGDPIINPMPNVMAAVRNVPATRRLGEA